MIITGGNSGIGFETARVLFNHGAHVYIACRNKEKMEKAIRSLLEQKPADCTGTLSGMELDLASLQSVDRFVAEFKNVSSKLHILICNAGIILTHKELSVDRIEKTIATNHFGHFSLCMQLLPLMKKTSEEDNVECRIVVLSSTALIFGKLNLNDLNYERSSYGAWSSYGRSKLANYLFCKELNRRLKQDGLNITANAVMPGVIRTNFGSDSKIVRFVIGLQKPVQKTIEQGAATTVYCAIDEEMNGIGGKFCKDCHVSKPPALNAQARNEQLARDLFVLSEKITQKPYPFS